MTISLESIVLIATFLAIAGPAMFYMGRLSTRVDNLKESQDELKKSQAAIFKKLDALADALRAAVAAGASPTLHCPLAEDERCAFRQHQKDHLP